MLQKRAAYNNFIEVSFHVVFWIAVIHIIFDITGLLISFIQVFLEKDTNIIDGPLLFLPVAIGLFYWNFKYLIPKYLNVRKWIKYCASLLLSLLVVCFFTNGIYPFLKNQGFRFHLSYQAFLDEAILLYMLIIVVSTTLGIAKTAMKNLSKKREAEKKQKEAELKYLANQFNPHFLHNTLNGIYSKAIEEDAPETTEAILRLSEIMRYPINQGLKDQVPLKEEIAFVEDYIALQKLRLGDDYPIQFKKDKNLEEINVLPLSLIILVENSFKYGVSQNNISPIIFRLQLVDNYIHFIAENNTKKNEKKSSHKIGLQNLRTRLQLLYNDQFELATEVKENKYIATLIVEKR